MPLNTIQIKRISKLLELYSGKTACAILLSIIFCSSSVNAQSSATQSTIPANLIVEQLKQATQELLDAVAPGKSEVWRKYLDEDCVYADEEGNVLSKSDIMKELKPIPKGYIASIKMLEPKVVVRENTIVLSHRIREDLDMYGQKLVTIYHLTGTWAKSQTGQWKLVAMQSMAIPNERKPLNISADKLDEYIGQYRLTPEITYTITLDGGKLTGQRTGRGKEELLPLYKDVLYKKGVWRGEKVFERNAEGSIVKLLDRRDNNDLVWEKIK